MNGERRSSLVAADAVFDAERALRRAAETVDELGDVAASALRVLDDAATDVFYAHQQDRREFYLESVGEHLRGLRDRSGVMNELGEDLIRHLSAAGSAVERAGQELDHDSDVDERDVEVRALRAQIEVLGEVVVLARPVADQITLHALRAVESSAATDALMLCDSRVHDASREVSRADEGVSMMRAVIERAQSRARTSAELAGFLSYAAADPLPPRQTHQQDSRADPGIAI
jgi:hypothetical protein